MLDHVQNWELALRCMPNQLALRCMPNQLALRCMPNQPSASPLCPSPASPNTQPLTQSPDPITLLPIPLPVSSSNERHACTTEQQPDLRSLPRSDLRSLHPIRRSEDAPHLPQHPAAHIHEDRHVALQPLLGLGLGSGFVGSGGCEKLY